jgi:rhomboid family GlyGly-CTERM serine protease
MAAPVAQPSPQARAFVVHFIDNKMTASPLTASRVLSSDRTQKCFRLAPLHVEWLVAVLLLVGANFTLLQGRCNTALLFVPAMVFDGEWWRILFHPFVHVSWYHLVLDATAFLLLYTELRTFSSLQRIGAVFAAGLGSLLAALCFDPQTIAQRGLCGLSAIAHGLMAIAALQTIRSGHGTLSRLGYISLLLVIGKCLAEAITGTVVFDFLHAGRIGSPVAVSHAGGILGALVAWLLCSIPGNHLKTAPNGPPRVARS